MIYKAYSNGHQERKYCSEYLITSGIGDLNAYYMKRVEQSQNSVALWKYYKHIQETENMIR